mmetsp:Transcript_6633/g.8689  ORF Transcript_6633/g.8689 Transcript_6633/m.8689 type:complete len:100 (+) Transcript_6633:155-454(+)
MSIEHMDNLCEKGIDEDAPQIWKQMLTATYALEFYESQSIENRRTIQSWKDKRLRLIEESRHKSLEGTHFRLRSMIVKNKVYGFDPQLCKCTKTRIIKV